MYLQIADGLIVDSFKPFNITELTRNSYVCRRIRDHDDGPEVIELFVVKQRGYLLGSKFWCEFKNEFPSAVLRNEYNTAIILISDPLDCINFTFKLQP